MITAITVSATITIATAGTAQTGDEGVIDPDSVNELTEQ